MLITNPPTTSSRLFAQYIITCVTSCNAPPPPPPATSPAREQRPCAPLKRRKRARRTFEHPASRTKRTVSRRFNSMALLRSGEISLSTLSSLSSSGESVYGHDDFNVKTSSLSCLSVYANSAKGGTHVRFLITAGILFARVLCTRRAECGRRSSGRPTFGAVPRERERVTDRGGGWENWCASGNRSDERESVSVRFEWELWGGAYWLTNIYITQHS